MPHANHHTQLSAGEQPSCLLNDAPWQELLALLPADSFEQARLQKAFVRARGLRHPADLLRGILAYVFCLSSFRVLGSWARSMGLCGNGERSWAKRTRQAACWLLWLLQDLLEPDGNEGELTGPSAFAGRIHLVDATHLRTWKRNGESRRLHMSYDLLGKRLEQVLLTDHHVGEGLRHFSFAPGDIVVGDSAYCRRQPLFDQLDAGVDVVVRLHWSNVPLRQPTGEAFDLSAWLASLWEGQGEQIVWTHIGKRRVRFRLLAQRLSEAAAKRAHRKRRSKARKNGSKNQPLTIEVASWLLVLTSLKEEHWSREMVLALYRSRWQIELLFKRLKQLVRMHRLRSSELSSNQAVLAGLLVGWTLMERQASLLREQADASREPEQIRRAPLSNWQVCATLVESLRTMLLGPWTWGQIQEHVEAIVRLWRLHPQARDLQESQVRELFEPVLAALIT